MRNDKCMRLFSKYELGSECGSLLSWKKKTKLRNGKDWVEEVSSKSSLKRYKLAKNGAGVEMYFKICTG